jgi:hypothetical protein
VQRVGQGFLDRATQSERKNSTVGGLNPKELVARICIPAAFDCLDRDRFSKSLGNLLGAKCASAAMRSAIVLITVFTAFERSPILLKGMEKAVF